MVKRKKADKNPERYIPKNLQNQEASRDFCLIDQLGKNDEVLYTAHVKHIPKSGCLFAKPEDRKLLNSEEHDWALYFSPEGCYSQINHKTFRLEYGTCDDGKEGVYVIYDKKIRMAEDGISFIRPEKDAKNNDTLKQVNNLWLIDKDSGEWRKTKSENDVIVLKNGSYFRIGDQEFRFRLPSRDTVYFADDDSAEETEDDEVPDLYADIFESADADVKIKADVNARADVVYFEDDEDESDGKTKVPELFGSGAAKFMDRHRHRKN